MKPVNVVKHAVLPFMILVLISSACSSPAAQPASPNPTEAATSVVPQVGSITDTPASQPQDEAATPTLEPTAPPSLADPLPLEVTDQGFSTAANNTVYYGFLVHNPNPSHAVQFSSFTTTFYDAGGAVLDTDELGAIELVLPGQTLGVSDALWLENPPAASMSIALTSGAPVVMTEMPPSYEVTNSSICNSDLGTGVRTEITSPYATNVILPRVSVIYYDPAGKIVGSGYGYRAGFLASGTTGVLVWGYFPPEMDRFEVYPGYRDIPSLVSTMPAGAQPLKVTASGYALNGSLLTYAAIIENPNAAYLVDQSVLAVNAYAADGKFLSGLPLPLFNVLPGQKLGVSQELKLCDGDVLDHIELAIGSGEYTTAQPTSYFASENVAWEGGAVNGDLVNQSGREIKVFYAVAVVYDAAGQIIGGGSQTVNAIAADGRATVHVPVTVDGTPARAELYGVLTRSSLKE